MYEAYSETHMRESNVESLDQAPELWSEASKIGRFALKTALSLKEVRQVVALYESQKEVSVMQHPEWDDMVTINGEVRYFTYTRDNSLLAYAIIRFPNPRIAMVEFGPVAASRPGCT